MDSESIHQFCLYIMPCNGEQDFIGVRGGEAPVCTACDSHTRERSGCGRSVLREETFYFATTFRQKVHFFAPFLDSKVAPGASFWPFWTNSCFYLSFCHRTSRRNKSWIEWTGIKLRVTLSKIMGTCSRKNKSVKKGAFFGPGSG